MGHRYYSPGGGRFLNRDPKGYGGGINLYGFAGNNPVNMADPDGTQATGGGMDAPETRDDEPTDAEGRPALEPYEDVQRERDIEEFLWGKNRPIIRSFGPWEQRDPIDKLTPEGKYPEWYPKGGLKGGPVDGSLYIQGRFWMSRARFGSGGFSDRNLQRMRIGLAPQMKVRIQMNKTGEIKDTWISMTLHHQAGNRGIPGYDSPEFLYELWPWQHEEIEKQLGTGHYRTGYKVLQILEGQ